MQLLIWSKELKIEIPSKWMQESFIDYFWLHKFIILILAICIYGASDPGKQLKDVAVGARFSFVDT